MLTYASPPCVTPVRYGVAPASVLVTMFEAPTGAFTVTVTSGMSVPAHDVSVSGNGIETIVTLQW